MIHLELSPVMPALKHPHNVPITVGSNGTTENTNMKKKDTREQNLSKEIIHPSSPTSSNVATLDISEFTNETTMSSVDNTDTVGNHEGHLNVLLAGSDGNVSDKDASILTIAPILLLLHFEDALDSLLKNLTMTTREKRSQTVDPIDSVYLMPMANLTTAAAAGDEGKPKEEAAQIPKPTLSLDTSSASVQLSASKSNAIPEFSTPVLIASAPAAYRRHTTPTFKELTPELHDRLSSTKGQQQPSLILSTLDVDISNEIHKPVVTKRNTYANGFHNISAHNTVTRGSNSSLLSKRNSVTNLEIKKMIDTIMEHRKQAKNKRMSFEEDSSTAAAASPTAALSSASREPSGPVVSPVGAPVISTRSRRKGYSFDEKYPTLGNKVSEGHENFVMAYNMLTGIRVAVSRCSGVMTKLTHEDFKTTKKLSFNIDGSELTPSSKYDFKFKDYSPAVFRELRSLFGIDPADYLVSITGKYVLSELSSPGKSGSFLYYSNDFRFIIKTIHHSEHKQLRRVLKDYYEHVKENPNTLVSQVYGLHRVKMPFRNGRLRKVHFLVMNNLFPPHRSIHVKYDLKGSTWGRLTKIEGPDADLSSVTLKDLNWLERDARIKFGPRKRNLFFKQLDSDVKFLQKINSMDYSLLLGIHDVKKGNIQAMANHLSVFDPRSNDKDELIRTNPRDIQDDDLPSNVFPGRSKYVFYGHDGGIRATGEDNNPIQEIYYLGIIDFLTKYNWIKRIETVWRSISHPRATISSVPATEYGDRFLKFIKVGTTQPKTKQE